MAAAEGLVIAACICRSSHIIGYSFAIVLRGEMSVSETQRSYRCLVRDYTRQSLYIGNARAQTREAIA